MKHKGRPDPYSDCICGSGKQFKWCCNAYYNDFKEGLDLSDAKQTAAAVAAFEKVVKKYPRLPQAWLLLASLASADQQTERAKAALQKAIELEPGTPRALALQIQILTADADGKEEFQSEMVGMCWQMLDQHYTSGDPYVADTIYSLFLAQFIANEQFSQNYLVPLILDEKIRNHIKGEGLKRLRMLLEHWQSKMYLSIGQRFLLPDPAIPAKQLEEWNQLLSIGGILKVKQGCEEFVKNNPTNVVGKFNLALVHTLLGNRTEAKPILEQLLADPSAGEHHEEVAYMLEVYEFSVPADELPEEYSGYVKDLKMRNPQGLQPMLEYFTSQKRALFGESSQNRLLVHLFGKSSTLEIPGVHKFVPQLAQFDAQALENQETQFNLLSDTEADMQQIVAEIQENIIGVFEIPAENEKYFNPSKFFVQVLHPALEGKEEIPPEVGLQLEHILNELWLKMPRKSLQGKTPLEAAQDPTLQSRLKGVVRMLYRVLASSYAAQLLGMKVVEDSLANLLSKLGLQPLKTPFPEQKAAQVPAEEAVSESAPATGGEQPAPESVPQPVTALDQFQAAVREGNHESAIQMAQDALQDPQCSERATYVSYLIKQFSERKEFSTAIALLQKERQVLQDQGETRYEPGYFFAQNKILAQSGDISGATEGFHEFLTKYPNQVKQMPAAIEMYLQLGKYVEALPLAEKALELAKAGTDRDLQGHLMELLDALRRKI